MKLKKYLPKHGDYKIVKKFAFLPVYDELGDGVWLEFYWIVKKYSQATYSLKGGGWYPESWLFSKNELTYKINQLMAKGEKLIL